eukprot:Pgem_evm1s6882
MFSKSFIITLLMVLLTTLTTGQQEQNCVDGVVEGEYFEKLYLEREVVNVKDNGINTYLEFAVYYPNVTKQLLPTVIGFHGNGGSYKNLKRQCRNLAGNEL